MTAESRGAAANAALKGVDVIYVDLFHSFKKKNGITYSLVQSCAFLVEKNIYPDRISIYINGMIMGLDENDIRSHEDSYYLSRTRGMIIVALYDWQEISIPKATDSLVPVSYRDFEVFACLTIFLQYASQQTDGGSSHLKMSQ